MKKLLIASILFFTFIFNSCLTYHVVDYTIEYADDFNSGTFSVTYTDIRSSEKAPEKQEKDFDELIELYKSDMFLLDQVDEGIYVKERKVNADMVDAFTASQIKSTQAQLQTTNAINNNTKAIEELTRRVEHFDEATRQFTAITEKINDVWRNTTGVS